VYISYGLGGSSFLALNNWPGNNEVESVNNGAMISAYYLVSSLGGSLK